jgi:hypothetical protein
MGMLLEKFHSGLLLHPALMTEDTRCPGHRSSRKMKVLTGHIGPWSINL